MSLIYLDNNATTVIHPEVANAMQACHQLGLVNPESQHQLGRQARRQLAGGPARRAAVDAPEPARGRGALAAS